MGSTLVWRTLSVILLAPYFSGCVAVPAHDGLARVHVGDVVKRIKCDLATIVFNKAKKRTPDGKYPFLFLQDWAAKIHLTIAVDDTVSVNPGATIIAPLDKTVATTFFAATTETFSLGIGAGVTTEAVRTEDIEFLVSFSDMIKEFDKPSKSELYNRCKFEPGLLLESDLGLPALINTALDPVEIGVLYQGNNVGPGAAPPPAGLDDISKSLKQLREVTSHLPPLNPNQSILDVANLLQNKSRLNTLISKFNIQKESVSTPEGQVSPDQQANVTSVKTILTYQEEAATEETRTQSIINNIVKPLYSIASASVDAACLTKVTQSQFEAITWSAKVSLAVINVDNATAVDDAKKALDIVKKNKTAVIDFADDMVTQIRACGHGPKKKSPPAYDPVNVISETVNFFVTTSGSLTPTWRLVKVTAPVAGTFLSGSRKDTNTLILAMGRPQPGAGGTITSTPAMDWQILASILSNAITSRPPLP